MEIPGIRHRHHQTAIAGPHQPGLPLPIEHAIAHELENLRQTRRIGQMVNAAGILAGAHLGAERMETFENPVGGREHIAFRARN